eukprot:5596809-Amphidinium_carterae.2
MLTKTTCPFCAKAKVGNSSRNSSCTAAAPALHDQALFKDLGVTYSEFALDMLNSQEKKAGAKHSTRQHSLTSAARLS